MVRNLYEVTGRDDAGDGIEAVAKAMETSTWRVKKVLLKLRRQA